MIDREAIVREAMEWIGTPWHHEAAVRGAGVDCAKLILAVFVNCGLVSPFEVEQYSMQWALHRDRERFLETLCRYGQEIDMPLPGDVVVFRQGRLYSHGAIVVRWPMIIHADNLYGFVTLENAANTRFHRRKKKFYELLPGKETMNV